MKRNKKIKKAQVIKMIVLIILVILIAVGYYLLANRKGTPNEEGDVKVTAVQSVLMRNLEQNYPPTPKEVIKYYSEITKCFYNEEYTEEELRKLALQAQGLYDAELVANKTWEQYLADLEEDIAQLKDSNCTIASYTMSSSVDIENSKFTQDGYEWVRVYCYYTLQQGNRTLSSNEVFLLRKDSEGHWKIYGWELID